MMVGGFIIVACTSCTTTITSRILPTMLLFQSSLSLLTGSIGFYLTGRTQKYNIVRHVGLVIPGKQDAITIRHHIMPHVLLSTATNDILILLERHIVFVRV